MVDNRRMGVFGIVLRQFTAIETFPLRQVILNVSFLQQRVSGIFLVFQDAAHGFRLPLAAQTAGNTFLTQRFRDSSLAHTVQTGMENETNSFGFLLIDNNASFFAPVAVQQRQIHGLSLREILANAPFAIIRNALALLLRKRSEDGQHQLTVPAQTVDILLLKIDRNAQLLQLSYRFQQRHRVTGEAADGFCEHPVDSARPAVCQQPLKLRAIVLRPGQRLVCVHPRIRPAGAALNKLAVMANLSGQRMQHSVLAGGHSAVGRNALQTGCGCGGLHLVNDLFLCLFHDGFPPPATIYPSFRGKNQPLSGYNPPHTGENFRRRTASILTNSFRAINLFSSNRRATESAAR